MSLTRHHNEWLSLVPNSGPFLSLPVLMMVFLWRDPRKAAATTPSTTREASDNPYQPPGAG